MATLKDNGYKFVAELPKTTIDILNKNEACKRACQKVVEEAIKHYENADIASSEFWDALKDKFNLDLETKQYQIQGNKLMARNTIHKEIAGVMDSMKFREQFGELIRESLEESSKNKKK